MSDLDTLRLQINEITEQMVQLFEKRLNVSKEIAHYKQQHQMPIFQPEREKSIIETYTRDAMYPALTEVFLKELMSLSKQLQKEEVES